MSQQQPHRVKGCRGEGVCCREHPIIMGPESVRAILDGRKTQTRRVVRPQPVGDKMFWEPEWSGGPRFVSSPLDEERQTWRCPYGVPGDRLWVKEQTIADSCGGLIGYPANGCEKTECWERKRSAMLMPRRWSRLTLEVVSVRAERLQSISDADAIAEGMPDDVDAAVADFAASWDRLNARRGFSWESNPWVWAIEFRRLDPSAQSHVPSA